MTEKLYCTYLGDVDINVTEIENGKKKIPHSYLADMINNHEKCKENKTHYTYRDCALHEPGHYAVVCVITDQNGRRVEGVGESATSTRKSEIAQAYPYLMACNRAFDAAAILFLGFPSGIVYSDCQIEGCLSNETVAPVEKGAPPVTVKPPAQASTRQAQTTAQQKVAPAPVQAPIQEPSPNNAESIPAVTANEAPPDNNTTSVVVAEGPPPTTVPDASYIEEMDDVPPPPAPPEAPVQKADAALPVKNSQPKTSGAEDPFSYIVNAGKNKNKGWTIRELAKNDPESLIWLANTMSPSERYNDLQTLCKRYIAECKDCIAEHIAGGS